jgi:hypothetical protein
MGQVIKAKEEGRQNHFCHVAKLLKQGFIDAYEVVCTKQGD